MGALVGEGVGNGVGPGVGAGVGASEAQPAVVQSACGSVQDQQVVTMRQMLHPAAMV